MQSVANRIYLVLNWADAMAHKGVAFDCTFVLSLLNAHAEGRTLTHRQETALDRIISRFHIERWGDRQVARGEDPYMSRPAENPCLISDED